MPGLLSQAQQCSLSSIGCVGSTSEMSNPRAGISFSLGPSFPLGRSRGASLGDTDYRSWTMSSYYLQIYSNLVEGNAWTAHPEAAMQRDRPLFISESDSNDTTLHFRIRPQCNRKESTAPGPVHPTPHPGPKALPGLEPGTGTRRLPLALATQPLPPKPKNLPPSCNTGGQPG